MARKQIRSSRKIAKPGAPSKKNLSASFPKTKLDELATLLRAPKGATLAAMMQATGWQAHSVRGALAGALKKSRGLKIRSERKDGVRVYHADA